MTLQDLTSHPVYAIWKNCKVQQVQVAENKGQDFSRTMVKVSIEDKRDWGRNNGYAHNEYLWMDPHCIWIAQEHAL